MGRGATVIKQLSCLHVTFFFLLITVKEERGTSSPHRDGAFLSDFDAS